jgi:hypothetical protein
LGETSRSQEILSNPAIFFPPAFAVPENAWLMCVVGQTIPFHFPTGEQTMTTKQDQLRTIFRTMDAHQAQEIREAYYKAVEGLQTLAEALEIADAKQSPTAGPLLDEHFIAFEAVEAMSKSVLGRIL